MRGKPFLKKGVFPAPLSQKLFKKLVSIKIKSFLLRKGLFIMQLFINVFFFTLWSKFGETRQKAVALVTTTLKAPLSVAKAGGRPSGRKFYTGNIYYIFLNIFAHIFPRWHIKRCVTEATHRKTQARFVVTQTNRNRNISAIL